MAHTFTETTGIIQGVVDYMSNTDNTAALALKDFDVAPHILRLSGKSKTLGEENAKQEIIKGQLKDKTTLVEGLQADGYNDASGLIDAIAGLLGKGTTAAATVQAIRKVRQSSAPATAPAPAAVVPPAVP